ncbi:MAG: AMP-binding protein [Parvularcula sp.]|jgi:2-aminobenzoate-CoA ligase|nr:AMP-binding protein [Parvularcula sp.]
MVYPAFDPQRTAHRDTFVKDRLPPLEHWPELTEGPVYPERLNAAASLVDEAVAKGLGSRRAILGVDTVWTYDDLKAEVDRIAWTLTKDFGLIPGQRVLIRAPNTPRAAAAWLAVLKAGGVAVATMPLLRSKELVQILDKAAATLALCDVTLIEELETAAQQRELTIVAIGNSGTSLETLAQKYDEPFEAVQTYQDDPALLAFTSGTTGVPKACVHFHRDILLMADTFSAEVLKPTPDDVFVGSPPLAFTFGLGALLIFPLRAGATAVLPGMLPPAALMEAAETFGGTMIFTSPTAYRSLLADDTFRVPTSVTTCVSAGEALPAATSDAWFERTGIRLIDGIGSTEMIHIFISACPDTARAGATGRPLGGYQARVVDDRFQDVPKGEVGRLIVRGPIGCRYLDDRRQGEYVQNGWNVTGDLYRKDEDGYFTYVSRADDMIVSSGYNIAAAEVEDALVGHPFVRECAVVGAPDEKRGSVVCAFVVLAEGHPSDIEGMTAELQDFAKGRMAPYKYPRRIEFLDTMPKTPSGKIQRHLLRSFVSRTPFPATIPKPDPNQTGTRSTA